jgi:hypothetical protein
MRSVDFNEPTSVPQTPQMMTVGVSMVANRLYNRPYPAVGRPVLGLLHGRYPQTAQMLKPDTHP